MMKYEYQKEFARALASSGALFFARGLRLKDGRPTPYFVNMGLFRTGHLSCRIGSYMAGMIMEQGPENLDIIIGPSYKGSALAVSIAQALWTEHGRDLLFDYDRKEAKTHGEATGQKSLFVTGALHKNARVFIVDDVGTTMGTKHDLIEKIWNESQSRDLNVEVTGVGLAVDREQTTAVIDDQGRIVEGRRGDDAIKDFTGKTGVSVLSLAPIRSVVHYLFQEKIPVFIDGEQRPIDHETLQAFVDYLDTYGVEAR